MIIEKKLEDIANLLLDVIPQEWERTIFFCEISKYSYLYKYWIQKEDGEIIDCYNVDISESDIDTAFDEVDDIVRPEWEKLTDNEKWTNFTFIFDEEGQFTIDYDYTDLTECKYEYRILWEYKYLNEMPEEKYKQDYQIALNYINQSKLENVSIGKFAYQAAQEAKKRKEAKE